MLIPWLYKQRLGVVVQRYEMILNNKAAILVLKAISRFVYERAGEKVFCSFTYLPVFLLIIDMLFTSQLSMY